jgi:pimeloyl-ACP methyl ester carboxylesterase
METIPPSANILPGSNQILNYADAPTQYITVEGVHYAYRSLGAKSGVPIVCLQHFTGTLDNWDPIVINGLAKERQLVAIDNAGVGNSGGTTQDNVRDMTLDAIKIIMALGINRCDLLGFSLGGFIAQNMAVIKPDLLRKIILVGTAPQGTQVLHSFPQLIEKAFGMTPVERYLFLFATPSERSRSKITSALHRFQQRQQDRDKETAIQSVQAQIKAITHWGTDPVTISLNKIQQPVLIIQGSNDKMMDSDSSLVLYKQIPNAILTYYPDSAHGSFLQYPDMFVDQANSFLNYFE